MSVSDDLAGVTDPRERHRIKCRAFAALTGQVGRSIKRGQFTVTLTSAPTFTDDVLTFSISIERGGQDITPPDLNPIRIVNPPVLVEDPAGPVVRGGKRFREDLPTALLGIVRELVR